MSGIFISYRRHDSSGWTGHLSERLEHCFGPDQIFMDIEKIEAGTDFVEAIESAVGSCTVLLAVIGPAWMTSADADGACRLENPEDFIRLEIATALNRNIRVIPVLVGGAVMPTSSELPEVLKMLTRRQAHELTDNRWDYDTEQLVKFIEKAGINRRQAAQPEITTPADPAQKMSKKAITSVVISTLILLSLVQGDSPTHDTKIGSLVIALAALALAGFAYFDIRLHKTKGKVVAIIGMVLSSLTLLAAIGLLANPAQAPAITGNWAGSDGLTYNIQQQGNMLAVVGGYPNQALIISGKGILNDRIIDLEFIRVTDNTGGKAHLMVSPNGRALQGQYRNLVTGETGEMVMTR